jgi:hypothetical protein
MAYSSGFEPTALRRILCASVGDTYSNVPILCDGLDANISAIVDEWKRLTDRPPWNTLPESEWVNHLPPLLRAMIAGVICNHGSHEARRNVIEKALVHGAHRRAHGLTVEIILEEQAELRTATWHFLTGKVDSVATSGILGEILRLDAAVSVATLASITGFHRAEVERTGEWNDTVAKLLKNWERASLVDSLDADSTDAPTTMR